MIKNNTINQFLLSHQMIGTKWGLPYHFYRPSLQKYGPDQWYHYLLKMPLKKFN